MKKFEANNSLMPVVYVPKITSRWCPIVILLPKNYILGLFCKSPLKAEMLKEKMKFYLGFFPFSGCVKLCTELLKERSVV